MTQFLIIRCHRYEFTSYYNGEERHMNFIQCLHTVASEADSVSVLKRKKYVSTLRGSSYKAAIITGAAWHSSPIWISSSCHLLLYLPCPAKQAEVRRTQGRLPAFHISSLFRQWVLSSKKPSFHLWVSVCTELRSKCGICKDAIRQKMECATIHLSIRSEEFVRCGKFLVHFVATSCSKSLLWYVPCQHV